ncbi:MAG: primosomal protein N' [Bacteroidota bacterium]|nr:primosomal protein N' [Bacteroidota bacterium]
MNQPLNIDHNIFDKMYVEVILPLNAEGLFTYAVPIEFQHKIKPGIRVEVEFGKRKHYSAIVKNVLNQSSWVNAKPIIGILDEETIVNSKQFELWEWMNQYYLASFGEIMNAALPSVLKLSSETKILKSFDEMPEHLNLEDDEYLILEGLDIRNELSMYDVQLLLQRKNVIPLLQQLLEKQFIVINESLVEQEKISKIKWIKLADRLINDSQALNEMLTMIQRSIHQTRSMMTYLSLEKNRNWMRRSELQHKSGTESAITETLLKKGVFQEIEMDKYELPISLDFDPNITLSVEQATALNEIKNHWKNKNTVLLHGITGSGKTMLYLELMREVISQGKQVLYLVPEIALTAQLVGRLKMYFGDELIEYHSSQTQKNKLAIWKRISTNHPIVIGARSAIFLPFTNLGLVIIDEEHETSYKQQDPQPRYHARDTAIVLASFHHAKILLGSATPSLESYHNAQTDLYGYVKLDHRYGESHLPEISLISMKDSMKNHGMVGHFTKELLTEITNTLTDGKQILLFRNRRGFSPILQCLHCRYEATCERCDINMTYHKHQQKLKCHICGASRPIPPNCPNCGLDTLQFIGFGTEKIEEELKSHFPEVSIQRLDMDTARTRRMQHEIIENFQEGVIQILVGTQMLAKGLDFENVALVGILQADQMLHFPDFRALEKTYQLLTQVSGRSGRRKEMGKVIIQGFSVHHPVISDVVNHDTIQFYNRELLERQKYHYPPFVRMIRVELRHSKLYVVSEAANQLVLWLQKDFGKRILGPADPAPARIKNLYLKEIWIKFEKSKQTSLQIKMKLKAHSLKIKQVKGYSSLSVHIDVDPL